MPAACTALGKAILASSPPDVVDRVMARGLNARTTRTVADEKRFREELRKTAARGVAFEREEAYVGVACVAAPILNSHDHAVAAVSVTGPATTFDPERFADATRLSALAISRELVRSAAVQRDGAGLTLEPSVIPGS
jgi:DNA-binding IclR family transcriptional regulator